MKREGTDVTLVSFGKILKTAFAAADELEKDGISCEVIDLRSVRPIDYDTIIESVKKTNRMVVVEEAWPLGAIASELTYMVQKKAFDYLDSPVVRVNTADTPMGYSPVFVEEFLPNPKRVIDAVKSVTYTG